MKLLMNAHMKQQKARPVKAGSHNLGLHTLTYPGNSAVNHHKMDQYVDNVCPGIRLRLATPMPIVPI